MFLIDKAGTFNIQKVIVFPPKGNRQGTLLMIIPLVLLRYFCNTSSERYCCNPSLDPLYGTLDTQIFTTSVKLYTSSVH